MFHRSMDSSLSQRKFVTTASTRVPAIWRLPGQIEADTTSDALMAIEDLMPTLSGIAGTTAAIHTQAIKEGPAWHE